MPRFVCPFGIFGRAPRGRRKKPQEPEPEPEVRDADGADGGCPPPANDTSSTAGDGNPPSQSSDDDGASPVARPSSTPASGVSSAAASAGRGDIFKILICTDNHLGFAEGDQIRGGDSFAAFEECLQLARHHGVDFVLNSGDVFHENEPSRLTLHRVSIYIRLVRLGVWGCTVSPFHFGHLTSVCFISADIGL